MTDDQSWDEIGYDAHGRVATPALDRLASEGTVFRSAYCSAIPCVPSRASLMSGLNFHRWNRRRNPVDSLQQGSWTWAHALRAAGYETVLIGKMHLTPRDGNHGFEHMALCDPQVRPVTARPRPADYDDYERWLLQRGTLQKVEQLTRGRSAVLPHVWPFDPSEHRISWVRDCAIQFLENRSADRPFALVVSFLAPHLPYDPAEPFASMYPPDSIEVPTDHWTDLRGLPRSLADEDGHGWRRDAFRRTTIQQMLAAYRALVSQVDEAIGAVASRLDRRDTLALFASDHGDYLGKRGRLVKSPPVPFEPLARVPMLAWGAGVPVGAAVEDPVSLSDIAPTWLAAAALEVPPISMGWRCNGRSPRPSGARRDASTASERATSTWCVGGTSSTCGARTGPRRCCSTSPPTPARSATSRARSAGAGHATISPRSSIASSRDRRRSCRRSPPPRAGAVGRRRSVGPERRRRSGTRLP